MACACLLLLTVLAAVTPGLPDASRANTQSAMPPDTSSRVPVGKIDLSLSEVLHDPAISSVGDAGYSAPDADRWNGARALPGVRLGPLRTEFGGVAGRRMHLATMRLEGISVLGANIGGSIDSRSARITFTWPSSP